ncbi:hypothetical protein F4776DRAFT_229630 [Hypoxylon sp. NC0597]|nr:hypothetical protein F4776DRAFT_229630 [Hypoxylon sp. NC0597]
MDSVPTTDPKIQLASLDISDPKVPELLRRNLGHETEPKPVPNTQGDDLSGQEISGVSLDSALLTSESIHTVHGEETTVESGSRADYQVSECEAMRLVVSSAVLIDEQGQHAETILSAEHVNDGNISCTFRAWFCLYAEGQ